MGARTSLEVDFESLKTSSLPVHSPSCLPSKMGALSFLLWPPCPSPAMLSHNRLLPSGIINQNNLPSLSRLGHGALSQKQKIN